jgi:predicted permease
MSMSVLLLIAAGLFIRSFRSAQSLDPGFDASNVVTASIDLETRGYSAARGRELIGSLTRRLETAPGIAAVNVVDIVPVTLSNSTTYLLREGDVQPPPGQPPPTGQIYTNAVGPGHFKTLGIGLMAGRDFTDSDGEGAPRVAIVNETMARRFWPGQTAIGQRLRPARGASPAQNIEIVGVVRDSMYVTVGEAARPFMYRPLAQVYVPRVTLLVRSTSTSAASRATIVEAVRAIDPALAVFNVTSLSEAMSVSLLPVQVAGTLLGALGSLALLLAALGIYGVLSFIVRSRTREIGLRVALGATRGSVVAMVLRQALAWTGAGVAIGIALAFLMTRFLAAFLYGTGPTDPVTFGAVIVLLVLVAGIAALVPAVRASRLDPSVALRNW